MTALTKDLLVEVEAKLDGDPVVASNTKWQRAILTLSCDYESWSFNISQGHVELIVDRRSEEDASPLPRIYIGGDSEAWERILSGLHGGLHRAFRHRLLSFEGDSVAMMSLWKTIWRFGEVLQYVASKKI